MNLDNLISKYLDGELSHEEDEQLRALLSEDDGAKDDFDSAVLVHAAIKEDAESISAPNDVVSETEDKIMMTIMNRNESGVSAFYRRRKYYSYAAIFLLFMIGTFYRIYDSYPIDKSGILSQAMNKIRSELINTQYDVEDIVVDMAKPTEEFNSSGYFLAVNSQQSKAQRNTSRSQKTKNVLSENNLNNYAVTTTTNVNANEFQDQQDITDRSFSEKRRIMNGNIATSQEVLSNHVPSSNHVDIISNDIPLSFGVMDISGFGSRYFDFYSSNNAILLSSFMGTELANSGINTNEDIMVSHLSQSIAYAIDNNNSVGVEIGLSRYSYDEVGSISYNVESLERIDNSTMTEGYNFDDLVIQKVVFDKNKEVFWASAFYERQMQLGKSFSVNGRLGLGASSDGPLGYSRLFAKYRLLNGIFLTAGAEGRIFYLDLPELMNTEPSLKTSIMLTYGLQFVL